jgi:signal transduction histidine kinase
VTLLGRSILRRLIAGQLLVVVFFCLLAAGNLYWQIYKTGEGEYDQQIVIGAKTILASLEPSRGDPALLRQNAAFLDSALQTAITQGFGGKASNQNSVLVALRVADRSGNEVYRTGAHAGLPLAVMPAGLGEFSTDERSWRGATLRSADGSMTVQLAQSSTPAADGIYEVIGKFILKPLLLFLPFAALLTWLSSASGLAPLREFATVIARRSPADMKPLEYAARYREIEPVVGEINTLLQKLDTTLTRERNFLADAAHELRTPLAVIQAQVHVLKHAKREDEKNAASEELNLGIARAASLIQKLLLTARVSVEDFTPRFETTNLTAFVQERIATFSVLAAHKKIEMALNAPARCYANIDRETFGSAVDNVLDNAIRYTPNAGTILVEIASLADGKVQLRIADNGHGIPPELHDRVFERFFRVAGTEQQGSGLGLAIVRRVLALHGGEVALSGGLDRRGLAVDLTVPVGA